MPYLNLDVDYFSHPKTVRLVGLLGKGAAELPIRLWAYCGKHMAEDGNLASHSTQEIEAIVGWWGEKERAVEAMVKVGFLDQTEDAFQVHDWLDHAGHLAAFKKRAISGAKKRWSSIASSNAKSGVKQSSSRSRLGKARFPP